MALIGSSYEFMTLNMVYSRLQKLVGSFERRLGVDIRQA